MSATLVPGAMVSQSVRLKRPLGAGNMGSVWVAEHLGLQTQVAVKFMSEMAGTNPTNRTRFAREAVAASQVKSPHVVQTFDHGETAEGMPFIVMELLEGQDLAQRIRNDRLSMRETASIVTQICLALARAHAIGVIHRDIKPANVFLCDVGGEEPFVKLLDFGIAKTTNQSFAGYATSVGAPIGTPYYMSPEQFLDASQADVRADLWSLAVVVYEVLLGVVPFRSSTIGGLILAINSAEFDPPSRVREDLPAELDVWFRRALARDPRHRFQTAKEFADSFLALASLTVSPSAFPPRPSSYGPPPGPIDHVEASTASSMAFGSQPSPAPVHPARAEPRGGLPVLWLSVIGVGVVAAGVTVGAMAMRTWGGEGGDSHESATPTSNGHATAASTPSDRPNKRAAALAAGVASSAPSLVAPVAAVPVVASASASADMTAQPIAAVASASASARPGGAASGRPPRAGGGTSPGGPVVSPGGLVGMGMK